MLTRHVWVSAMALGWVAIACGSESTSTTGDGVATTTSSVGGETSGASGGTTPGGGGSTSGGSATSNDGGSATSNDGGSTSSSGAAASTGDVTWHQDIAPLAASRCAGCHREGGIGPFSLEDYDQAAPLAGLLASSVAARTMPPWGALDTAECDLQHGWKHDLRLSDEEIELFARWADAGAPEGDAANASPLPEPPSLELDAPTANHQIGATISVEGTQDQFWCFSIDPGLTEDVWVTGLQIKPGNAKIVHHVLVFPDEDGVTADLAGPDGSYPCNGGSGTNNPKLLGAWAPGAVPVEPPEGVGMKLAAGSRLLLNVHYHPTGAGTETDSTTSIDVRYETEQPEFEGAIVLVGNQIGLNTGEFVIPPGVADHVEGNSINLPPGFQLQLGLGSGDLMVWAAGTHMHYIGVDMKMDVHRGAAREGELTSECLVQTPQWDFEWQRAYEYDAPLADLPRLRVGDTIQLRCTYDNTLDNPNVRLALDQQGFTEPQEVRLGEETLDEMCLGVLGVAYAP